MPDISPLLRNFKDIPIPIECVARGTVPSWLKGTLLRNGPGIFRYGNTEMKHLFDGHAFVERYFFEDGKMFYSGRVLQTDTHKRCSAADRIVTGEFGTTAFPDPCKTLLQRFFSFFTSEPVTDNAVISFAEMGDSVYALAEVPVLVKIDTQSLDVKQSLRVSDNFYAIHTCTAHQHFDKDGNVFNIGSRFGGTSKYVFTRCEQTTKDIPQSSPFSVHLVAEVSTKDPAYFHSFGFTENHFVLLESPMRMNIMKLAFRRLLGVSIQDCLQWKEGIPTNVIIINSKTGKQLPYKVTVDTCFTFHHANSYEKDGFLVCDISSTPNGGTMQELMIEALRKEYPRAKQVPGMQQKLNRFIVPLEGVETASPGVDLLAGCPFAQECTAVKQQDGSVHLSLTQLSKHALEFPRYNYEYNGREYRFCYGTCDYDDFQQLPAVAKVDVSNRTSKIWKKDHLDQLVSEPAFIQNPAGTEEDDGILVVPVMTTREGDHPFVVILDSKEMNEIARFEIPVDRIALAFHMLFTQL